MSISILNPLLHPAHELGLDCGVNNVAEPLLRQLVPLLLLGQVVEDLGVSGDEGLDLLHAESVVLGNGQVFDLILPDLLPRSRNEVL